MAGKRIQGLTIEIDGKTDKLSAALKNVDNSLKTTKSALSDVEKLLKFDPGNAELLAQKQKLLGDAVSQTKERLAKLKEASEQAAKTKGAYDAWKAAITPLWQEIDKTSKHLEDLKKKQAAMKDAGDVNSDAYNALQKEIEETSEHLKKLKADAKAVTEEFGHPISPEKYDALQREIIQTENDLKGLEDQSGETGDAEKKLADESQEAGKGLQFLGDAAKAISATLAAAFAASTAAVVAFSKSAVDVGSAFDKSLSQVAATMGKTTSEISNLRDFAQEMGAKTAFSATQAASALNFMALAGYDAETSMSMLPNVLNLAAAGSMELASAADMITDSQSALGLSLGETSALVDQMAAASSKANASVSQMGSAILTVGGTAKTLAGGTTELNTVLGLLADNGVKGAEGGTALRNMILSLTAPTDKAAATLKELGVKALDSSGDLRSMQDIFTDLNRALSGMSEGKKTEVLNEIFNKTDLKSVNALLATNVDRWGELSDAIEHSKYAAELMADTQLDNLAGDVTLFQSALEGAQIVVSDVLMPSVRNFVQFGTEGMTRVTDAFKNADVAKSIAEGFRDAEGVMKPVEENADAIREKLSAFRELAPLFSFRDEAGELKELNQSADEFYHTISQLSYDSQNDIATALGLANVDDLYEVLDPNSGLTWKLEKLFETADAAMEKDRNLAKALLNTDDMAEVNALLDETGAHYKQLQSVLESQDPSAMTNPFSAAMEEIPAIVENGVRMIMGVAPQFLETGATVLKAVASGIRNSLPAIGEAASGALSFIVDGILTGLPALTDSAVNAMTSFGESIRESLPGLMKSGLEIAVGLSASIRENAGKLVDGAISLALSLAKGLADSIPAIVENVPTIVTNIANVINDNAPKILKAGVGIIITLVKGLIQAIPTIVANIPKIIQAIVAVFTAFNWLNLGKNIITAIKNGVTSLKTAIPNAMKNIGESAKNFVHNINWFDLGNSIVKLVKNGIVALTKTIPEALRSIGKSAFEAFKSIDWLKLGKDVIDSIVIGLFQFASSAVDAMIDVGAGMVEGFKQALGLAPLGEEIDEELAESVAENAGVVEEAGEELAEAVAEAVASQADEAGEAGEAVAERFAEGVADSAGEAVEEAGELAEAVTDAVVSQADAFAWVGEMFGERFAEGIASSTDKAESEAEKFAKQVYSAINTEIERQTKYQSLSLSEQLKLWREAQQNFDRESEQWWNARDKVYDLETKIAQEQAQAVKDTYNGLVKDVEYAAKRYGMSTAEQLAQYEAIRDRFERNSEEWLAADEKVFDTREKLLKEQAQTVKDTYNGLVKDVEYAAKRYGISTAEQLAQYEAIRDRFERNSEEWLAADEKVFDTREKLLKEQAQAVKDTYNGLVKDVEYAAKRYGMSTAEQLAQYEAIRDRFERNSEEWLAADEKVFDTREKLLKEQAQTVRDTYDGLVKSVEYATKRYGWSTQTQLSQYEEIRDRFERGSEEWLAADEKAFDTRQALLKEQESAWKDYAANLKGVLGAVSDLESGYQQELAKRAGEIANSYNLFAEVPDAEKVSGRDLLKNLRAQVESVGTFYENLEKLSERGVGAALVDEIRSMGVGASDELEALLKLSDRRLEEYAELYGEKQELANNIAVRELSGLREETDAKIRENLDSIESLYDEYAPVIGQSLPEGLAEGIRNGMQAALDAADELAAALQAKFDDMGGGSGLQALLDTASDNAQILAIEPASQRRQSAAVREESYDYGNGAAYAGLRSAPVNISVSNNVGGRLVEQLNYSYREAETARRGPSFVRI